MRKQGRDYVWVLIAELPCLNYTNDSEELEGDYLLCADPAREGCYLCPNEEPEYDEEGETEDQRWVVGVFAHDGIQAARGYIHAAIEGEVVAKSAGEPIAHYFYGRRKGGDSCRFCLERHEVLGGDKCE